MRSLRPLIGLSAVVFVTLSAFLSSCCCCRYGGGGVTDITMNRRHKDKKFLYGTFKFVQRPDQVFVKPSFATWLKANPNCSVVLRVPNTTSTVSQEEGNGNRAGYFAFEKILLENNFNVNDRTIFEKNFAKEGAEKIQTDLIVEMVDYQQVYYSTNKVIPQGSSTVIKTKNYYYFDGARAEFKIVHVKTNEVVATFVLNYTPCTKGCAVRYTRDGYWEEVEDDVRFVSASGTDNVRWNRNEIMFTELATRVINELRK